MKFILFLIIGFYHINSPNNKTSQIIDMHLCYEEDSINNYARKYYDTNGQLNFHIKKEHFISINEVVFMSNSDILKINFNTIQNFIQISNNKRRKLIADGEDRGVIKLISNKNIFQNIYIYEQKSETKWSVYEVEWVDEIEN